MLFLVGCAGTTAETTKDDTLRGDMDTDTTTAPCVVLTEGPWSANGSCFGHDMTMTLVTEGDGCTIAFSDWSMGMSVPDGGTVSRDDVLLTGPYWDDCSGTTDGDSISGGCITGCALEMAYDG